MSRVDAVNVAVMKARASAADPSKPLAGSVAASDAFFPFRDGLDAVAAAGATAVVQPGGSVRDAEVIAAADEHGLAMVFTGRTALQALSRSGQVAGQGRQARAGRSRGRNEQAYGAGGTRHGAAELSRRFDSGASNCGSFRLVDRRCQFMRRDRRRPELADDDARGVVGEDSGFGERSRRPRAPARALPPRYRRLPSRRPPRAPWPGRAFDAVARQPHAVLAASDQHRLATGARHENRPPRRAHPRRCGSTGAWPSPLRDCSA